MNAPRIIPNAILEAQIAASDPAVSAWVAANAGSGKTHVLAQRVIRLLLDGVDPSQILCITFTKAAAANMSNRVFGELSKWTRLDDAALDQAISRISSRKPDAQRRALARRLFATALETPGGLKVQTIHAFCTRLLHQFPFEANVAARFTVLDEAAEAQLFERMRNSVLLEGAAKPDSPVGRALAMAIATATDFTFREVMSAAIRQRSAVMAWLKHAGGIDAAMLQLCGTLGLSTTDTPESIAAEIVDGPLLPRREWRATAEILRQGSKTDSERAETLITALGASGDEQIDDYLSLFFTDKGEARKSLATKSIENSHPALCQRLKDEQKRLPAQIEKRRAVAIRDRTWALLTISSEMIARYQAEKNRRGLLDYDDQIEKTLALLGDNRAAWVHYKLDRGIDHVLIDEAQDTSPQQWEIVQRLTSEFFAGSGARPIKRTIFAVGDEKQSIFSFQGAAPGKFDEMRREFIKLSQAAEHELRPVRLDYSFRSGEVVLGAVDRVFRDKNVYVSVTSDEAGMQPHLALPDAVPGLVELWDTTKADDKRDMEAWDAPFDAVRETSSRVKLARRIAAHARHWIAKDARPGEILVLVRQRGEVFEAVIRALKEAGIAVAGADRLVLTEHIAVMDLLVLGDALLLPEDDLALATVLKSPLFGLTEEDLFRIAWNRRGSLRVALRSKAGDEPRFAAAETLLTRLTDWARTETPFGFYARILGAEGGRRKIIARLGAEADDALNEFLNLALDYEARETPSLQGFLAWIRTARTDVKRDMEMARDEVRVMTVHGAKGLEARIVILADTTTPPGIQPMQQPRILALQPSPPVPGAPPHLVWAPNKRDDVTSTGQARAEVESEAVHEHRRLLYVGMTRAAERLVICGADGKNRRPAGCWYDLIRETLQVEAVEEPADDGDGTVWRYRKAAPADAPASAPLPQPMSQPAPLPAWLMRDTQIETPRVISISPSTVGGEAAPRRPHDPASRTARQLALLRGTQIHRLLQSLPDIPLPGRADAAERYLARQREAFEPAERREMVTEVLRILNDLRFAPLFIAGSRAEVSLVGQLERPGRVPLAVSGQIDRLAVTATDVLIGDFKTNRPAPRRIEDVPESYVNQLALYRALLTTLYPRHIIRAALIWTDVPDLMEISAATLDHALARLTCA